ncbi:MAG: hypothetical protein HQL88_01665 [Magnetococcales bacterium]|nr:hypothetical protein [Magnetococcales bacterium]
MSIVLNALKKSDRKHARTEPAAPPLPPPQPGRRGRWQRLAWLLLAVTLALVAAALYVGPEGWWTTHSTGRPGNMAQPHPFPEMPLSAMALHAGTASTQAEKTTGVQYRRWFQAQVRGVTEGCRLEVAESNGTRQHLQLAGISCLPLPSLAGQEARRLAETWLHQEIQVAVLLTPAPETQPLRVDLFDRENRMLNRLLVRQGLVEATDDRFQADAQEARTAQRGLWQNPDRWRRHSSGGHAPLHPDAA